ncbi:MAG: thermonuclease family protein, partial [Thiohalomonadales bacterium]
MSAFFISALLILTFISPSFASTVKNIPCLLNATEKADETVMVSRVIDGDTVQLKDGRKIRLIGINSPETNSSDHTAEPYAQVATIFVRDLLKISSTVQIRYGAQKKDHYGRLLAHVFLNNKQNLNALILQKGFARSLYIPPNDWQYRCYDRLDKQAQQLKVGLWSNKAYQTINVNTLKPEKTYNNKFLQVSGIVSHVGNSKNNIWINLGSKFVLRIDKSSLIFFNEINFDKLPEKKIIARGYV